MKSAAHYLLSAGAVTLVAALSWNLVFADKATTQNLGGAERYLTAVSTDKPIYKPGEQVYIRGVVLGFLDHKPLPAATRVDVTFEVKGPKGDTLVSAMTRVQDSSFGTAWQIPNETPGGEYTVKITYPWLGHAPAERKFDIRAYRAPRLRSQIVFLRDGYGPGEQVSASVHVERAEGGIPEGAKVSVIARVDGAEIRGAEGKVDAAGNFTALFALPAQIARGEGALALIIEDGGVVETASKTIPILLQTLDVKLYPEGGDLVSGIANRIYFEARQTNGKPADIEGEVIETAGNGRKTLERAVATFKTEHEGRGRFILVPKPAVPAPQVLDYALRITRPAGIKTVYPLPAAKDAGVLIRTTQEVFAAKQPIAVSLIARGNFPNLKLTLSKCENEIAASESATWASDKPGNYSATLDPKNADGVLRLTVWDEKGAPLAERLIYREPADQLNVQITPGKKFHVPGETVTLNIKTTDAAGKPVGAVVGLSATDDSILEMVDKREQSPRLPVMVLLEPEVRELADAHVYLDAQNPKAPLAVDLLLGTQGWRRFAFMDIEKFIAENGDPARRVLALRFQSRRELEEVTKTKGMRFGAPGALPVPMAEGKEPPRPVVAAAKNAPPPPEAVRPAVARKLVVPELKEKLSKLEQAVDARKDKDDRKAIVGQDAAAKGVRVPVVQLVVVREFAHLVRPDRNPADRIDFAETLYWNAGIKTDALTGEATVSFGLNDSVTTFRVFADGFDARGALAASNIAIESVQPFYVEPKLPVEATSGDTVLLPINVVNSIASELSGALSLQSKGEFTFGTIPVFELKPMDRTRKIVKIDVGMNNAAEDLVISASAGPFEDKVTRKFSVKPMGFPIETPFGGMIGPDKPAVHTINIPDGVVARSTASHIAVYPTPLANMTEALERLIQDPSGCFEQTSSTSYPLTMAQQYFLTHTGVDPKVIENARTRLDAGYKRLVSFWCPDRGFEWFGQDPGHEALTAFGVLHFSDMAQVREVDPNMIATTRAWLLKQRDGKGGFERKRRALHTWIEDKDCSNGYIVWALLESGEKVENLATEIAALKTSATQSQNSYAIALAANVFALAGEKADATKAMDRLVAKQDKEGGVEGGTATIVGSGGEALKIETAALAALAWMRDPAYAGAVEKTMKFLADSCKAGRYGSTQSTVLALRAIVTYDKQRARPKAPGKVRVFVDGQSVGTAMPFDLATQGAITLPDLSELLTKGGHKIELKMEAGSEMPYSIAVNYNALTPASAKECKLDLGVSLASATVEEGGITEANVVVTNKTKEVLPTPVAIVGIPGGLEPRHDQLKELVKKGTIDAYEVKGREVVLYWRSMAAEAKLEIPLSLVAAVPGTYTGPASRAYLYYTDEHKHWLAGVKVNITPK